MTEKPLVVPTIEELRELTKNCKTRVDYVSTLWDVCDHSFDFVYSSLYRLGKKDRSGQPIGYQWVSMAAYDLRTKMPAIDWHSRKEPTARKRERVRRELELDGYLIVDREGFLRFIEQGPKEPLHLHVVEGVDLSGINLRSLIAHYRSGDKFSIVYTHNRLATVALAVVRFVRCNMRDMSFSGVGLSDVQFEKCDLRNADLSMPGPFKHAANTRFTGCDMQGADLSNRHISGLSDCKLRGVQVSGACIGEFSVSKKLASDIASGVSRSNLKAGDFVHMEQLVGTFRETSAGSMKIWPQGITVGALLGLGLKPVAFVPHTFVDYGGEHTLVGITEGEVIKIMYHPDMQACVYPKAFKETFLRVLLDQIIGLPADITRYFPNYGGDKYYKCRPLLDWFRNQWTAVNEAHDTHPWPFIGTDPIIRHMELLEIEDLGIVAGAPNTRANVRAVFDRVMERHGRELLAQQERQRRYNEERALENEALRALCFPSPSADDVPPIPDGAQLVQLTDLDTLTAEGVNMKHCVGLYAASAAMGREFIYHIGAPAPSGATLSIDPRGRVNQLRSYENTDPCKPILDIVHGWLGIGRRAL